MSAARLLNRDFVLLWQGQLVSQVGHQAFLVGMVFWTLEATGSASVMGLLLALSHLPGAVLGPFGGTLADRYPRLRIIIVSDILRGLAVIGLAAAMWAPAVSNDARLALLFATALLGGIIGAFFTPAITAAIPDLVPVAKLTAANSMHQTSSQVASLAGQAAGGVLFQLLGAPMLFLIDGVTYLFSAASEALIRLPPRQPDDPGPRRDDEPGGDEPSSNGDGTSGAVSVFLAATREGLAYVWRRRGMRDFLLTASVFNFIMMPVIVLLPFLVQDYLGETAEWYGFLLAAMSGGVLLGLAAAGAMSLGAAGRARLIMVLYVVTPVTVVLLGSSSSVVAAMAAMTAVGLTSGMINVYVITLLQSATPPEMRGRVMGLLATLAGGLTPIGLAVGGVVGDLTGRNVPLVYAVCGGVAVLVSLSFIARRECRTFLASA